MTLRSALSPSSAGHLRMRVQRDALRALDALHQVVGHRRGQPGPAHQHVHVLRAARQEDGGLAGGVAAADDDDLLVGAEIGLHRRRRVVDAGAFEAVVAGDVELAIARAGGDDDGARADRFAVVERERVRRVLAVDADDGARQREPRAELLRLHLRAAGERLPRDAGRKAEVVLDLRARARLAARRHALDDDRLQSFRGAVDRGRESGRPGADDGEVEHLGVVEALGEPEVVGHLRQRRIAQHAMARRDHHRQVGAAQREAVEKAARVGVVLGVEQAVRIGVAAQELEQPHRVGAVRRTDDDDAAVDVADQADAAQDERAHDDLADVGLGRDQAAEVGAAHAQQDAVLAGARADQHLALVEEVELAGELARAQDDEDLRRVVLVDVEDLDRSRDDDEEIDAAVAAREDRRARRDALLAAVARHPREHLGAEAREGLRLARDRVARVERGVEGAVLAVVAGGHGQV